MRGGFKKLSYLVQYGLVRIFVFLINLIPFSLVLPLARPLGSLLFLVSKRQRKIALENLHRSFQTEKSEAEIQNIARGTFNHLAEFGIEWLRMPKMIRRPEHYFIGGQGFEHMHQALKKARKGAILLVCHIGNWEVMALPVSQFLAKPVCVPIYAIARPLKNPYLYRYVVKVRGGLGLRTIDKSGGVRETFDRLRKENAIVCILIDQRVSEGNVEVNLFGRPALTTALPAITALRIGSPIFFNFLYRTSDCRYEMKLEGPFPIERTGDFKQDIQVNTQRFVNRVEEEIKKDPAQWLWMHNRWRVPHGAKD